MTNLSHDSECPGRDSSRTPPEYKSRTLQQSQPARSVTVSKKRRIKELQTRSLTRTFASLEEEVPGGCREPRNQELNVIRTIKPRMRWSGHVACVRELRDA
jgi:hypothetical protein